MQMKGEEMLSAGFMVTKAMQRVKTVYDCHAYIHKHDKCT